MLSNLNDELMLRVASTAAASARQQKIQLQQRQQQSSGDSKQRRIVCRKPFEQNQSGDYLLNPVQCSSQTLNRKRIPLLSNERSSLSSREESLRGHCHRSNQVHQHPSSLHQA